jgi:hypothetical protein
LLDQIGESEFQERAHGEIGKEQWLPDPRIAGGLTFLVNDPRLVALVEQITECGRIGSFDGRIYRFVPGSRHFDSWHDDLGKNRLVAMSLNLGREPYAGGVLQIRNRHTGAVLAEVVNRQAGDAVLFRLREDLQHQVTPLEGNAPRTVFAGWYRSEPDFPTLLGELVARRGSVEAS